MPFPIKVGTLIIYLYHWSTEEMILHEFQGYVIQRDAAASLLPRYSCQSHELPCRKLHCPGQPCHEEGRPNHRERPYISSLEDSIRSVQSSSHSYPEAKHVSERLFQTLSVFPVQGRTDIIQNRDKQSFPYTNQRIWESNKMVILYRLIPGAVIIQKW